MHRPDEHRHIDNPPPAHGAVRWLIGIDDTDNLESRGTGYLTRGLAAALAGRGLAHIVDVTRHQLLIDPRVRYTSRNGALCLHLAAPPHAGETLWTFCRRHVLAHAAHGSDAGLALVRWQNVPPSIETFGAEAQTQFVLPGQADEAARAAGIRLEGLTGDHGGKIGALAAIGLRHAARNGRVAWAPGLREMEGVVLVDDLLDRTLISAVRASTPAAGQTPERGERVRLESWARAVMIDGEAVALVERNTHDDDEAEWTFVGRDVLHDF